MKSSNSILRRAEFGRVVALVVAADRNRQLLRSDALRAWYSADATLMDCHR